MTTLPVTDPLTFANAYAGLGWRVVPLRARGNTKAPIFDDWPELATREPTIIDQWWGAGADKYGVPLADRGVGLAAGPDSGFWALDVDPDKGGDETLADFEAEHGPLPDTVQSLTGGGGAHYLFRFPELGPDQRIANTAGKLGPGLDVRAAGGQIVVAPTVHPDTGARYEWEASHLPHQTALADAPQWLLDLVIETVEPLPEGQVGPESADMRFARDCFDFAEGWHARAVELLERHGWHSPRTDRRGVTFMVRPGKRSGIGLSIGKIPGVIYVFTDGAPPLTPRGYRLAELYAELEHAGDRHAADRQLVASGYGLPTYIDPAETRALIATAKATAAAERVHDAMRDVYDFLAEPDPEYDWLVPGLLERGDRLILTGQEGKGKSTLLRQLGAQMAAGIHPFDGPAYPPVRVVLIDLENSARHLRRKIRGLIESAGPALERERFYVVPKAEGIDLGSADDVAWLNAVADAARPDVLIIGPIYKMSNGDPTEETTAKPIVSILDHIRVRHDCAILVEAHTPQESNGKRPERPYGASLWRRWPEFGIFLDPKGTLRHWRGARDEREWPAAIVRGEGRDPWPWMVAIGRDVTYMAMVDIQRSALKRLTVREIADRLISQGHMTASKSTVARAIAANQKHWDAMIEEHPQEDEA